MFRLFHWAWSWNVWKWIRFFFMMPKKNNNNSNKKNSIALLSNLWRYSLICCVFVRCVCFLFILIYCDFVQNDLHYCFFFFLFCYLLAPWCLQDNLSLFIGWSYFVLAARKTVHIDSIVLVNKQPNFESLAIKSKM